MALPASRALPVSRALRVAVLVALMLARPLGARANPQDVEEGEPVTIEDAWTDPPGDFSMQYSGSYGVARGGGETDLLESGPTLKLGAIKGVQVSINPNYDLGPGPTHNSGFALADVLVQLNDQTAILPATAVDVFYSLPFGSGQKSVGTAVRAIASKWLGPTEFAPRLHINLTDYHLSQPGPGQRSDQLQLAVGGSIMAGRSGAVVADVVTGASAAPNETETYAEIGYSRDLPDDWNCQIGFGQKVAGVGHAVRVFFAIEKEIQIY